MISVIRSSLGCLVVVLAGSQANAEPAQHGRAIDTASDSEIFDRAFRKQPRNALDRVPAQLFVDDRDLGMVIVDIGPEPETLQLPARPIIDALAGKLAVTLDRDLRAAGRSGRVSAAALAELGLTARYDSQRLEIRIAVPPELRASAVHDLGASRVPEGAAEAIAPSDVSGFLNLRGGGGAARPAGELAAPRTPFHANFDGALNVHGWVLESRLDVVEGPIGLHRGDLRLTRDLPAHALRLIAGDLATASTGLQTGYPLAGVSLAKNFALQPYRTIQPVAQFGFLLERASQVTVYVNGAAARTLALPAGRHDLRDLPLGAGLGEVELQIKDDLGGERRVRFRTTSASGLLARGLHQYAYGVGFPLVADHGARIYDWTRPTAAAWHATGVTDRITLGLRLDATLDRQLAGHHAAFATPVGSVAMELAASHDIVAGLGRAATVRYDHARAAEGSSLARSISLMVQHHSSSFRTLGPGTSTASTSGRHIAELGISASSQLPSRLTGALDVRYQLGGDAVDDVQSGALALSRSFRNGLSIQARLGARRGGSTPDQLDAFVTATWSAARQVIHSSLRTSSAGDRAHQLAWSSSAGSPTGFSAGAAMQQSSAGYTGSAELTHTGYRVVSKVSATTAAPAGDIGQGASFELGTALAFAGGRFAWSRPITDSFVIVVPIATLKDEVIGVNPTLGKYAARVDSGGAAVIGSLQPYQVNGLRIEAADLPVGSSLGPGQRWVRPAFKSGSVIEVGEEGTVFLRGALQHADGRPVALAVGEVVSTNTRRFTAKLLMTNRAGRFAVEGLSPGRHVIQLTGMPGAVIAIAIEIPARYRGVYSVGAIRITAREPAPTAALLPAADPR